MATDPQRGDPVDDDRDVPQAVDQGAADLALSADAAPVCAGCFAPVEAGGDYCPHCGRVVGQFTEYVPFTNIAWQVQGYGRLMDSLPWHPSLLVGKLLIVVVSIFLAPALLLLWAMRQVQGGGDEREPRDQD